jgi:hypothetical protein
LTIVIVFDLGLHNLFHFVSFCLFLFHFVSLCVLVARALQVLLDFIKRRETNRRSREEHEKEKQIDGDSDDQIEEGSQTPQAKRDYDHNQIVVEETQTSQTGGGVDIQIDDFKSRVSPLESDGYRLKGLTQVGQGAGNAVGEGLQASPNDGGVDTQVEAGDVDDNVAERAQEHLEAIEAK